MEKLEIYCNYGVLAAEKRNVYTYSAEHVHATCSDKMTVAIPKGWDSYHNTRGHVILIAPWGVTYEVDEVLCGDKNPCFEAIDNNGKKKRFILAEV